MVSSINNSTVINVKPFEKHNWVKWCVLAMYMEALACCMILALILRKELSMKLSSNSIRPLTQQLVLFSILIVSTLKNPSNFLNVYEN